MTADHVFDEIPTLLAGHADRATTATSTAHLRDCEDCRDALVNALSAHVALSSAARFAADLFAVESPNGHSPALDPPILDRIGPLRGRPSMRSSRWLIVAAAVIAVAVAGSTVAVLHRSPAHSVTLDAFGQGTVAAAASVRGGDEIDVDAPDLPPLEHGDHYEVWLTDSTRTVTVPIGALGVGGTGKYHPSPDTVRRYDSIEVSVQQPANGSTYSGHSVLRGSYA